MKPKTESPIDGNLVLLKEEHSGRDEMNLAGNPFALLHTSKDGESLIFLEWEKTLPSGKIVKASWEVNGHVKLGLPGPNDELLFLVLMQLTREQSGSGEWVRKVHFSRFDLLMRLGWPNTSKYYQMLEEGFARLSTVTIRACHTFWDAKAKAYADVVSFHIIEDRRFFDEKKGRKLEGTEPLSWFEWNKTVHESFLAGNVRSLALNFIISLNLPTTRRLFRYLDMMRGATSPPRREFTIGVFKLCEKLGMTSYKYVSKSKEKLQPAIDELMERHYLEEVRYEKSKEGVELAHFIFAGVGKGTGRADMVSSVVAAKAKSKGTTKRQLSLDDSNLESDNDIRTDAVRCHLVFQSLEEDERNELMELAKKDVSPVWHDRVGLPESPMSLGLWQLVALRYPEKVK